MLGEWEMGINYGGIARSLRRRPIVYRSFNRDKERLLNKRSITFESYVWKNSLQRNKLNKFKDIEIVILDEVEDDDSNITSSINSHFTFSFKLWDNLLTHAVSDTPKHFIYGLRFPRIDGSRLDFIVGKSVKDPPTLLLATSAAATLKITINGIQFVDPDE